MNRIFKTLKNRHTGAATAVSELHSGRTKGSGAKATALAAAVLSALVAVGPAEAVDWTQSGKVWLAGEHTNIGNGFAFGNTGLAALSYDEDLNILRAGQYTLTFEGRDSGQAVQLHLDKGAMSLFDQMKGFNQALVSANRLNFQQHASFNVDSGNTSNGNIFVQDLFQGENKVAEAEYVLGYQAAQLERKDGSDPFAGRGIWYDATTIYTASVLANLKLAGTLNVGISGEQTWGARLSGEGDIVFTGSNSALDVVTIDSLFVSAGGLTAPFDGANTQTGVTRAENVTLNLVRASSLGTGSAVFANAVVNEQAEGALGNELASLSMDDSVLTAKKTDTNTKLTVGSAEFTGENTLANLDLLDVTGSMKVDQAILHADGTAIKAGDLTLAGADITAKSIKVTGKTAVTDTENVTLSGALETGELEIVKSGHLTAENVTADSAILGESSMLVAGDFETGTDGTLTLEAGAGISATSVHAGGVVFKGENGILTEKALYSKMTSGSIARFR